MNVLCWIRTEIRLDTSSECRTGLSAVVAPNGLGEIDRPARIAIRPGEIGSDRRDVDDRVEPIEIVARGRDLLQPLVTVQAGSPHHPAFPSIIGKE